MFYLLPELEAALILQEMSSIKDSCSTNSTPTALPQTKKRKHPFMSSSSATTNTQEIVFRGFHVPKIATITTTRSVTPLVSSLMVPSIFQTRIVSPAPRCLSSASSDHHDHQQEEHFVVSPETIPRRSVTVVGQQWQSLANTSSSTKNKSMTSNQGSISCSLNNEIMKPLRAPPKMYIFNNFETNENTMNTLSLLSKRKKQQQQEKSYPPRIPVSNMSTNKKPNSHPSRKTEPTKNKKRENSHNDAKNDAILAAIRAELYLREIQTRRDNNNHNNILLHQALASVRQDLSCPGGSVQANPLHTVQQQNQNDNNYQLLHGTFPFMQQNLGCSNENFILCHPIGQSSIQQSYPSSTMNNNNNKRRMPSSWPQSLVTRAQQEPVSSVCQNDTNKTSSPLTTSITTKTTIRSYKKEIKTSPSKKIKMCKMEHCEIHADTRSPYCIKHRGQRKCENDVCNKFAQSNTRFCIKHGGGRRCTFPNCDKGARGKLFCGAHGGGRRCISDECSKLAVGGDDLCTVHGGGKRCQQTDCTKSAQSSSIFCVRHGGGRKCKVHGCAKVARGKKGVCMSHESHATAAKEEIL